MIFHENRLPAEDSHEISCLICYFLKLLSAANYRWRFKGLEDQLRGSVYVLHLNLHHNIFTGLQINVTNIRKLFYLFFNQIICCGYSKELSR